MSDIYEHEIRVTWGDCDPAKIAYTARLPWFALDAINGWWEEKTGDGWFQMELDRGFGTPFVNMNMDFKRPVTPRHRLICKTWPVYLGNTSVRWAVDGYQDDKLCFSGRFTNVFIKAPDFVKQPPPDHIRALVQAHLIPDEAE